MRFSFSLTNIGLNEGLPRLLGKVRVHVGAGKGDVVSEDGHVEVGSFFVRHRLVVERDEMSG